MILNWKKGGVPDKEGLGQSITDLELNAHGTAFADCGIFRVKVTAFDWSFKDGKRGYNITVSGNDNRYRGEIEMTTSVDGYLCLLEAIEEAEKTLFSEEYAFLANDAGSDHAAKPEHKV